MNEQDRQIAEQNANWKAAQQPNPELVNGSTGGVNGNLAELTGVNKVDVQVTAPGVSEPIKVGELPLTGLVDMQPGTPVRPGEITFGNIALETELPKANRVR